MAELAESSKKEYARIVKAIEKSGFKDDDIDSLKAYFDDRKYCIRSRRINITACIHKHHLNVAYCDTLRKYLDDLRKELQKLTEDQTLSEKQEVKHLEWDKVLEKAVPAINNEKYLLEDRILLGLYTQLEPVRLDYTHIKLYDSDPKLDKGTYFIINDTVKEVVINDHKESKIHGAIRQPLPERLAEMITIWFKGETVMFPISESAMSHRIKGLFLKVTGKPMTATALRHSRITFAYRNAPMPKEARKLANAMGHTVATAQTYRFAPE
jgi:integrase